MTGECGLIGIPLCLNFLMFENRNGTTSAPPNNENMFSVLKTSELFQELRLNGGDVVSSCEKVLSKKIEKLIRIVGEETLELNFLCSKIQDCIKIVIDKNQKA